MMAPKPPTLKDLVNIHVKERFPYWKFEWFDGGTLIDNYGYIMTVVFEDKALVGSSYVLAADPDFFPLLDAEIMRNKEEVRKMWRLGKDENPDAN